MSRQLYRKTPKRVAPWRSAAVQHAHVKQMGPTFLKSDWCIKPFRWASSMLRKPLLQALKGRRETDHHSWCYVHKPLALHR